MKKFTLLSGLVIFYVFGTNIFLFAGKKVQNQSDVITLDLMSPTNPAQINLNEKGYWTETYNTAEIYRWFEFGRFKFSHMLSAFGGDDVGGGMSYWDGFTYCTSGDITDYGELGSSDGWVAQQWGCMPGGGIKADANGDVMTDASGKVLVQNGNPYLVAYWGYWMELMEGGAPCLQVRFTDDQLYQPVGVYVANHPWPYYGNIHGDGFARPFTEEGDYFKLIVHGLNQAGEDVGSTVEHVLAEFKDGQLYQSPDWEWMDLSELGTVSGIYFTMETSDADPIYGPNTAVYFCLDKLQVRSAEASTAPSRPTGLTTIPTETTVDFSWTASTGSVGVKGYNLYLNGIFESFVETTQFTFTALQPYTQYQIEIEAVATDDTASEKASVAVRTTDETAPTAPLNLTGTTTPYTMTLSWNAATDNVAVTEYHIYLNGERQKRVYTTGYTLTGLDADTEYLVEVEARDAAGNRSTKAGITLRTQDLSTNLSGAEENTLISFSDGIISVENPGEDVLEIYSISGQHLTSFSIPSVGKYCIDITHFSRGMYLLKNGSVTKKIIKQ